MASKTLGYRSAALGSRKSPRHKDTASSSGAGGGDDGNDPRKGKKLEKSHAVEDDNLMTFYSLSLSHTEVTKGWLTNPRNVKQDGNAANEKYVMQYPVLGHTVAPLVYRDNKANSRFNPRTAHYRVPLQAHIRGATQTLECTNCQDLDGPFVHCRTLGTYNGGACTNCSWGGHHGRCSFTIRAQPTAQPTMKGRQHYFPGVDTSDRDQLYAHAEVLRGWADIAIQRGDAENQGERIPVWENDLYRPPPLVSRTQVAFNPTLEDPNGEEEDGNQIVEEEDQEDEEGFEGFGDGDDDDDDE